MQRFIFPTLFFALSFSLPALAQSGSSPFEVPPEPGAEALRAHDLRWIHTANDFDQTALSPAAIDLEIERRVSLYDRETAIATLEVPINRGRLSGPDGPKQYTTFDSRLLRLTDAANVAAFARQAYFWSYNDFHIAVPGDTYRDQLNVYAVARALEVLRVRYPDAYQRLFQDVRQFSAETPGSTTLNNRFSAILFSFDDRGAFALGGTAYQYPCPELSGVIRCSNLAIVSLNPVAIGGGSVSAGSLPIYRKTPDESYMRYLREGLVETLVHEMLHRYVDHRATHEAPYTELRKLRLLTDPVLNLQLEEAFITATSLGYFLREGGLQGSLPFLSWNPGSQHRGCSAYA